MKSEIKYLADISKIEQNSIDEIYSLKNSKHIKDIFVFPDIHISTKDSMPVGVCFSTKKDIIYPLISGKDIGCGVAYMKLNKKYYKNKIDKNKFFRSFYNAHLNFTDEGLGGGNHFLSLEEDKNDLYIIVHTGTRNNGIAFYQKTQSILSDYRIECNENNINYVSIDYLNKHHPTFFEEYDKLLKYSKNRRIQFLNKTFDYLIHSKILDNGKNGYYNEIYDSMHNYIEFENDIVIHRKGVTGFSGVDSIVPIPLSMTRGTLFVKQCAFDALNSCAHGAGRIMSRADALNHWYSSMKKKDRKYYYDTFPEFLKNGEFQKDILTEFDFAYKSDTDFFKIQPHIYKITQTTPILTVKFQM